MHWMRSRDETSQLQQLELKINHTNTSSQPLIIGYGLRDVAIMLSKVSSHVTVTCPPCVHGDDVQTEVDGTGE